MRSLKFSFFLLLFFSIPVTLFSAADPWVVMADGAEGKKGETIASDASSVFALAKSILAITATGGDATDFVKTFLETFVRDGQIGSPEYVHDDFWGALALRAGGMSETHPAIADARAFILRAQHTNGGWSWSPTYPVPDTDDTAAAVMALLEAGVPSGDPAIARALSFLRSKQNSDGGFPNVSGQSSVDSTAWVLAALNKFGEDGTRARGFLQSKKRADGTWGAPATTAFVRIALVGKTFPVQSAGSRGSASGNTRLPAPAWQAPLGSPPRSSSFAVASEDTMPARGPTRFPEALPLRPQPTISLESVSASAYIFPGRSAISIFSKPERQEIVVARAQDSDGDGYADEVEMAHGYDPHDPAPCRKKVYSTTERNVYGGMRLAGVEQEQCRSQYLRRTLQERRGTALRFSPHDWLVRVNAYLYGGYTLEEIAMWG